MTKIAFQHWQQFIAITLIALTLGMGSAHAAKFDINTATAAEMQKNLDGIGPVKAKAIVNYRRKNGKFKSTDDLLKVPGIGPGTVKKNLSALSLKRGKTPLKSSTAKAKASSSAKSKAKNSSSAAKKKASSKTKSVKSAANSKSTAKAKN